MNVFGVIIHLAAICNKEGRLYVVLDTIGFVPKPQHRKSLFLFLFLFFTFCNTLCLSLSLFLRMPHSGSL